MYATLYGIARIIRTGIVIRASRRDSAGAGAVQAGFSDCARIAIIARESIMSGNQRAGSRVRITQRFEADGIGTWNRVRADNNRVCNNIAIVGPLVRVAEETSVALVPVFKGLTVSVTLTVARYSGAGADAFRALIRYGTGIPIVAIGRVVLERAAPKAIALIVSAGIGVITNNRRSYANTRLTVIADGADISVHTLPFIQGRIGAAISSVANILGATVIVVAQVD